jgi:cysteine-rich repeat protein
MALSLARIEGTGTTPIPLTPLGGGTYEAVMVDACDDAGPVNLLIVATDSTGNELSDWLTPAFACRPATCGNGTPEPGEACDDGNLVSGDGCNSVCSSTERCGDGVRDTGEQCDDGNAADGDGCNAMCENETNAACPLTPQSCRSPVIGGKAYLSLTDKTPDGKDQLHWRWKAGAATTKGDFGDPNETDYVLCLYDGTGRRATYTAPAGGLCRGKPCWKDTPKGFQYVDKDATPTGLTHVRLSAGASGKATVQVKGRGTNLPDLDLSSLNSPVTVQLVPVNGSGLCFGATYTFPPAIKNDAGSFKDTGQ